MDRRAFFMKGTLGASGLAVGGKPALVSAAQRGGSLLYGMDDYMVQVDAGLARIDEWSIKSAIPDFTGDSAEIDELGRKSLKSLFLTGMFVDLPVEAQVHPGMQDRMWAMQQTMDEATDGMMAFLGRQTPETLAPVRSALRNDPSAVRKVADFVDREAALTGISDARRAQTRTMFEQAGWRLEHQPPTLLINEYLDKVEKVAASDVESEAQQRWIAAKVGEKVFWAQEAQRSRRERRISRGLKTMGIGLLIGAVGGLLIAASDTSITDSNAGGLVWVGAVAATVGSIFFLVGLTILLVGAATSASAT